jgi:hypothetical protein
MQVELYNLYKVYKHATQHCLRIAQSQVWGFMPVIPAMRRLRQADHEVNLSYIV